jgi:hypothetical protein
MTATVAGSGVAEKHQGWRQDDGTLATGLLSP